jgi:hypothetical protein
MFCPFVFGRKHIKRNLVYTLDQQVQHTESFQRKKHSPIGETIPGPRSNDAMAGFLTCKSTPKATAFPTH